jgi:hypothetical protein
MDRACATLRYAATKFRAGHPEHVAQDPQQRHIIRDIKCANFTVYPDCWHGSFLTTVSSKSDNTHYVRRFAQNKADGEIKTLRPRAYASLG